VSLKGELRSIPRVPGSYGGQLADNLMHFARVLREVGVPVGPGALLRATEALQSVGLRSRGDLYWTLSACFVSRREHRPLFDQAFHVFWRNPQLLERMMSMMLPQLRVPKSDEADKLNQRLTDALNADAASSRDVPEQEIIEHQSTLTGRGRDIDLRATLRTAAKRPDCGIPLATRQRRTREPTIVALCDISGSMAQYSRMMLHFLHALTRDQRRVHSFVFGTRLTNITRSLAQRDVDEALDSVSSQVCDWSGGTRIADSLLRFNRDWGRRVMSQGAIVLLITEGAKALLPNVHDFRSVHNLTALSELGQILSRSRGNTLPARPRANLTVVS